MKTQRYLFLLSIICISFLLVKCGKDGAVGPAGSTGDKGAAGAQGAVGPAGPIGADGKAGSIIYSGSTTPLTATGVTGDFYLNSSTGLLYGPKTAAGWGAGVSLKGTTGATGATGAAGSKTLSGTGAPATSLGSNGDFYLNKSNYLLYGPKTDAGWGAGLNLQGPVGPAGPAGPAGTANVIYSDWITPATYTKTTVFGTVHFSSIITAAKITQDILDKGTVIVYGKLSGYNPVIWPVDNVAALPIIITYMSGANSNIDTWSGITSLGQIQIDLTSSTNAYSSISNAHSFRYVIIPGGVHTTANINLKNYAQVKQAFHLTD
jgi:hypothetical protein